MLATGHPLRVMTHPSAHTNYSALSRTHLTKSTEILRPIEGVLSSKYSVITSLSLKGPYGSSRAEWTAQNIEALVD